MALQLGWIDVDAMLASISSSQLTEWLAFDEIDPIGERRADLRNAMAMRMFMSANLAKGKTPPALYELMPFEEAPQLSEEQSWKAIQSAMRGMRPKARKGKG